VDSNISRLERLPADWDAGIRGFPSTSNCPTTLAGVCETTSVTTEIPTRHAGTVLAGTMLAGSVLATTGMAETESRRCTGR
jgi:hypothetical protein